MKSNAMETTAQLRPLSCPSSFVLHPSSLISSAFLGFLLLAAVGGCSSTVSDAELQRRVSATWPSWENYQEDIKAQIGVKPVAEWEGAISQWNSAGNRTYIQFQLRGPWATRDAVMPVLLREPTGEVHHPEEAGRRGDTVTYVFQLPEQFISTPPAWVELKFPRGESRLIASESGRSEIR